MRARPFLTLAMLSLFGLEARAEQPEPAENKPGLDARDRPSERIVPPERLNTPIEPVAEATDHVEIILELLIDKQGHVVSARAVGGSEPYATRAIAATKAWSFRPATKGGEPVAARVSFLVTFDPPLPPPPLPAAPAQSSSTQAPAAPPPPPEARAAAMPLAEVLILGELPDPGVRSITRAETRKLAGAFDDPLRAIEVLPGVSPILTGLPLFFVRGAPPGNVGYFLDGIRIPQLYHAFLGPSVLHPAFLSSVNLHAGPMPARFGRYAGGAVSADLAEPHGELRGEASVRLFDAGGFVEAPFAGGRGYAMAGARYSFTALLLTVASPGQRLDYWDYQAMAGYRLGKKDEVRIFAFGSFDYVGSSENVQGGVEFHRVDLTYSRDFSQDSRLRVAVTAGSDRTRSAFGFVGDLMVASRANYTLRGKHAHLRIGADVSIDDYSTDIAPGVSEPEVYQNLFPPRTDVLGGAYAELVLFPNSPIRLIPGTRADVFYSYGDFMAAADVRLAAEYRLTPWLAAKHAFGTAHQAPSFVPNVPGAQVGGLHGALQQSLQASTAYEFSLPAEFDLTLGGYVNLTDNLSDPIGGSQTLSVDETSADVRALGRSAGLEVFLKRPLSRRLGGLLSYTFSTSLRSNGNITTVAGYDRPHVLTTALTYDLGRHWQASLKFALASGIPGRRTTLDGFVFDGERSAPLVRLDAKLAKRWYVSDHFNWGLTFEVLNATYAGSVSRRICGRRGCQDEGTAPILVPSIGIDGAWN